MKNTNTTIDAITTGIKNNIIKISSSDYSLN